MTAALVIAAIVLLALAALGAWLRNAFTGLMRSELAGSSGDVERKLADLAATFDRRLEGIDNKVDKRLEGIDTRLLDTQRSAGQTATQIVEKLGKLDGTATQMLSRANDLARLEQALRPPKARGGFGELLLENLLRDRLPASAYSMQHTFDSGERVDAIVRVGQLIPVDSKFPLDNYQRIVEAESDDERLLHEKAFARDVRNHVESIARKYIRPAEGTYDFAFMYVASEAVYYELACGKHGALDHAHAQRVFPVSPSTFTAYLQVIALGLRGMQIEQRAEEVMAYVAELGNDFDRFVGDFETIGTHLGHAQKKYGEAEKRLGKFGDRLDLALEEAVDEELEVDADDDEQYVIEAA
ncbi:MAG TPA: DNA recombination protein RmuC [Gaiellaceae bacterium]